ncbi:MAG: YgiT-type zinc finger protein [Deltaproteobacteria bacterium]|nr:YgiT-type zinc finger protein [Deltaproteobacteria bacterium]
MHDGIATLPFLMGEKVAVITNVPAEICSECGASFMKTYVVGNIETLLDRIEEIQSEVSVIYYKAA